MFSFFSSLLFEVCRLIGIGQDFVVGDVRGRASQLPLLLDPGQLLEICDAMQKSGKQFDGHRVRVLSKDVATHHTDHRFLSSFDTPGIKKRRFDY